MGLEFTKLQDKGECLHREMELLFCVLAGRAVAG